MGKYGLSHVLDVAKRICLMAHQPLPRMGQPRRPKDDYVVSAVLMEHLKTAIKEVEILEINP